MFWYNNKIVLKWPLEFELFSGPKINLLTLKLNILWHYSPNNSAVFYIYILMKKANRIHDSCHLGFNIIRFLWLLNI